MEYAERTYVCRCCRHQGVGFAWIEASPGEFFLQPVRVGLFDEPSIPTIHHPELARTHEALGAADSAIAVYERYLSTRCLSRATADAFELATTLERLGLLYAARGDRARAAACYRRLAGLWRDADARLRPRAAAARRRADALYP